MKTNKQLLEEALDLLHTLEDRTNFDNMKLGTAINNLQDLLMTIDEPVTEQTIQVGVYYYLDANNKKVYDTEEMMREFQTKLEKLPE